MDDDRRLDAAVSLGIITGEQAEKIRALTPDRRAEPEAPRANNSASMGYVLGALTVLIAMAWFLADRWEWLGAGGVLIVVALYAALFYVVSRRLRAEGFPNAAGILVVLMVMLTPVAVAALNELVGWFDREGAICHYPDFIFWACRGEEVVMELATAAAALFALRKVRFSLLVVPLVAIGIRALFHTSDALFQAGLGALSSGWIWVIGASALTAIAYHVSRVQRGDEDFAFWLHLAAVVGAIASTTLLLGELREFRHLLVPGAVVALFFALRVRRLIWQLLGLGWFACYLIWLASDVFSDTPFFPIVLAAIGVGMIIVTVWVQRNSARLVARFGGVAVDGRPTFPGGIPLLLAPMLVALLNLPSSVALDQANRRSADAGMQRARAESRRAEQARRDSVQNASQRETDPVPRP